MAIIPAPIVSHYRLVQKLNILGIGLARRAWN